MRRRSAPSRSIRRSTAAIRRGRQPLRAGSWAMVPAHQLIATLRSFSIAALVWPTLPGRWAAGDRRDVERERGSGFGLMLNEAGEAELRLGSTRAEQRAETVAAQVVFRRRQL